MLELEVCFKEFRGRYRESKARKRKITWLKRGLTGHKKGEKKVVKWEESE